MLGAIIGAGASLIGGRKARRAQRRADEENHRRALELNALNDAAVARQNAFNVAQIDKQNKFNESSLERQFRRNVLASDRANMQNRSALDRSAQLNAAAARTANAQADRAANLAFLRNSKAVQQQNEYNSPAALRARAESAGFNPLLFAGAGVGQQAGTAQMIAPSYSAPMVGAQNYGYAQAGAAQSGAAVSAAPTYSSAMVSADNFGSAISNAGLLIADGINAAAAENARSTQLAQENQELRRSINGATLRPEVPGVYGTVQPVTVPTNGGAAKYSTIDGGDLRSVWDNMKSFAGNALDAVVEGTPTTTALITPGVNASTESSEGMDVEDLATGLAVDGINIAKAKGDLPMDWERPFYNAARGLAGWTATKLHRAHVGYSKKAGVLARERAARARDGESSYRARIPKAGQGKLPMQVPWWVQ